MPQVVNWNVQKELQFAGAQKSVQYGLHEVSNRYRRQAVLQNFTDGKHLDAYKKHVEESRKITEYSQKRILSQIQSSIEKLQGYRKALKTCSYDRLVTMNDPKDMDLEEWEDVPQRDHHRMAFESKLINSGWNPRRLRREIEAVKQGDEGQKKKAVFTKKLKRHMARHTKEQLDLPKDVPLKNVFAKRKARSIALATQRIGTPQTQSVKLYTCGADTYMQRKTVIPTKYLQSLRIPFKAMKEIKMARLAAARADEKELEGKDEKEEDKKEEEAEGGAHEGDEADKTDEEEIKDVDENKLKDGLANAAVEADVVAVRKSYVILKEDQTKLKPGQILEEPEKGVVSTGKMKREPTEIKAKPALIGKDMVKKKRSGGSSGPK